MRAVGSGGTQKSPFLQERFANLYPDGEENAELEIRNAELGV